VTSFFATYFEKKVDIFGVPKAVTYEEQPKMKRDTQQKSSPFLLFCQVTLFIFCCSSYVIFLVSTLFCQCSLCLIQIVLPILTPKKLILKNYSYSYVNQHFSEDTKNRSSNFKLVLLVLGHFSNVAENSLVCPAIGSHNQ
jgi:hypothetical protein